MNKVEELVSSSTEYLMLKSINKFVYELFMALKDD